MIEKICVICGKKFYVEKNYRQKFCSDECRLIGQHKNSKKYREKHIEEKRKKNLLHYYQKKDDKEYIEKRKAYRKKYYAKNKEKAKEYNAKYIKNKLKTDNLFKLKHWCRQQINRCLRSPKEKQTFSFLDYTPLDLKNHLENQFTSEMSWENYGTYWSIDHIRPISSFNFIDENGNILYNILKDANSLSNLQPLTVEENLKKSKKYNS